MSDDFLDSNVILYMFDEDERKRTIAQETVSRAMDSSTCISFQVIEEVLNGLLKKAESPASYRQARNLLQDVLLPLWRVMPSPELYGEALRLRERYGYAFYDSLIIAAVLEADCDRLYSEDLQDGQRIEGLTIINPFADA